MLQLSCDQKRIYLSVRHFPWINSSYSVCQNLSIRFTTNLTFSSPIALASIPSSGNTWVRAIIEEATGIFTGSMYDVSRYNGNHCQCSITTQDDTLSDKGFYGELLPCDAGMTPVVKTHDFITGMVSIFLDVTCDVLD